MKKLLVLAALCVAPLAPAQTRTVKPAEPPAKHLDFGEGEDITGEGDGPSVELIEEPPEVKHSNLIKVREDFKDKVMHADALP